MNDATCRRRTGHAPRSAGGCQWCPPDSVSDWHRVSTNVRLFALRGHHCEGSIRECRSETRIRSRSLGKSRLTTFQRVTLPLAWPGIIVGFTLAFACSIGEFGATLMLAYYPRTMPVEIWVSFTILGLENAFPVAVILVGIAVGTLVVLNILATNPLE